MSGARFGNVTLSDDGDQAPAPAEFSARTCSTNGWPPGRAVRRRNIVVEVEVGSHSVQVEPLSNEYRTSVNR